jgi:E3 ubiquitin-protein ligase TRIP12
MYLEAVFLTQGIQGLIRLLSTCASGSPLGAKTLLLLGVSGILKEILSGSGVSANSPVPPALSRPVDQVPTCSSYSVLWCYYIHFIL